MITIDNIINIIEEYMPYEQYIKYDPKIDNYLYNQALKLEGGSFDSYNRDGKQTDLTSIIGFLRDRFAFVYGLYKNDTTQTQHIQAIPLLTTSITNTNLSKRIKCLEDENKQLHGEVEHITNLLSKVNKILELADKENTILKERIENLQFNFKWKDILK